MFIGRSYEIDLIRSHLNDKSKAKLLIIYGRRRVGKSTLMRRSLRGKKNVLFFEGIEGEHTSIQIDQFLTDLSIQTKKIKLAANNWREVFQGLGELIENGEWTLVFDEFPWMGSGNSRIVSELKLYWDRWSKNKNLTLFLCGSIASFMVKHLIHSKAFHNRKTLELRLKPLSPKEVSRFLPKRSIYEQAETYMCFGGIPKYLEQLNPNISLRKNIAKLCFSSYGFFIEEYETLFKEQFRSIKVYQSIVEQLAKTPASLSDLSQIIGTSRGGGFKQQLDNLVNAQFIKTYSPIKLDTQRTKTQVNKLVDPFLLFYFRYIHPNKSVILRNKEEDLFESIAGKTINQYFRYAFERLCEDSMEQIIKKLGLSLSDIENMGPFFQQRTMHGRGLQIDWILLRRDKTWSILEFKYSENPIGTEIIDQMRQKISRLAIPANISIETVLIASHGVTKNVLKNKYFNHILSIKELIR